MFILIKEIAILILFHYAFSLHPYANPSDNFSKSEVRYHRNINNHLTLPFVLPDKSMSYAAVSTISDFYCTIPRNRCHVFYRKSALFIHLR